MMTLLRTYVSAACLLLSISAGIELLDGVQMSRGRNTPDPVFEVDGNVLVVATSLILALTSWHVGFRGTLTDKLGAIGGLGIVLALYHFGLQWIQPGADCPCLGTVWKRWPELQRIKPMVIWTMIGYLLTAVPLTWLVGRSSSSNCEATQAHPKSSTTGCEDY